MSNTAQLSARERIETLLDDNSFVEIGALVTKRNTDFNMQQKETPADGVITGYGLIECSLVYVYSQDMNALHGSIGEMHARKIVHLYELALKTGAPVIGLIDCAGLRLEEAADALHSFGEIYLKESLASGVIPQITAIFGNCGGGCAVMASLSDFTFMSNDANLFINSPNALENNYKEKCDTSNHEFQAAAGNVDFTGEDDADVLNQIRELINVIPSNNEDDISYSECEDDLNRMVPSLSTDLKDSSLILREISDDNFFMEIKKEYAKEMTAGFIRLNGMTIGAVANRQEILDEEGKAAEKFDSVLTTAACRKAQKFIKFCDAFSIPVLSLINVTGYKATKHEERTIAAAAAKLTYTFANATVPKVSVIVGKAYGSAYIAMNSKHIGADMVFAWENTEIGTMDADSAAEIIYADEIKASADKIKATAERAAIYKELQNSAESAAKRGYVDAIVPAQATRQQLIYAYEMLFTKRESHPKKKHGTV